MSETKKELEAIRKVMAENSDNSNDFRHKFWVKVATFLEETRTQNIESGAQKHAIIKLAKRLQQRYKKHELIQRNVNGDHLKEDAKNPESECGELSEQSVDGRTGHCEDDAKDLPDDETQQSVNTDEHEVKVLGTQPENIRIKLSLTPSHSHGKHRKGRKWKLATSNDSEKTPQENIDKETRGTEEETLQEPSEDSVTQNTDDDDSQTTQPTVSRIEDDSSTVHPLSSGFKEKPENTKHRKTRGKKRKHEALSTPVENQTMEASQDNDESQINEKCEKKTVEVRTSVDEVRTENIEDGKDLTTKPAETQSDVHSTPVPEPPNEFKDDRGNVLWDYTKVRKLLEPGNITETKPYVPELLTEEKLVELQNADEETQEEFDRNYNKLLWFRQETRLDMLNYVIKKNLSLDFINYDAALTNLQELANMDIPPLMLKKRPEIVYVIRKLRRFAGGSERAKQACGIDDETDAVKALEVREKANNIVKKFEGIFLLKNSETFWQVFRENVKRFNVAVADVPENLRYRITHDPDDPWFDIREEIQSVDIEVTR